MPYAIAMAGKGGTGKTTVAGFLIKYLVQKGKPLYWQSMLIQTPTSMRFLGFPWKQL